MSGFFRVPLPTRPVWRQAVRMTVAALVAYLGTVWLGLAEGYWAVITCLVIVQSTLGGTLNAAVSRITGTVAGGVLDFTTIDRACEDIPPDSALRLVHAVLRQDLDDLCAQIAERRRSRP